MPSGSPLAGAAAGRASASHVVGSLRCDPPGAWRSEGFSKWVAVLPRRGSTRRGIPADRARSLSPRGPLRTQPAICHRPEGCWWKLSDVVPLRRAGWWGLSDIVVPRRAGWWACQISSSPGGLVGGACQISSSPGGLVGGLVGCRPPPEGWLVGLVRCRLLPESPLVGLARWNNFSPLKKHAVRKQQAKPLARGVRSRKQRLDLMRPPSISSLHHGHSQCKRGRSHDWMQVCWALSGAVRRPASRRAPWRRGETKQRFWPMGPEAPAPG
jgi:hypothetical protein